jgi:hypothetical protein
MDASNYEDLAGRLYGLLIGLDDRIGSEQAQLLHHFIEVGEYGLPLEEIAGALAQDTIAITGQERGDMLALAARMKLARSKVSARRYLPVSRPSMSGPRANTANSRVTTIADAPATRSGGA